MTALGVSLLIVGAIVIVAEAHVPSLGMLGGPGVIAIGVGAVLAVSGLGGGLALALISAILLVAIGLGAVALSVTKGMAVRRRRGRAEPAAQIGPLGGVGTWGEPTPTGRGDRARGGARRSIVDEEGSELHVGDQIVVEHLTGLTVGVRPAEEWELT